MIKRHWKGVLLWLFAICIFTADGAYANVGSWEEGRFLLQMGVVLAFISIFIVNPKIDIWFILFGYFFLRSSHMGISLEVYFGWLIIAVFNGIDTLYEKKTSTNWTLISISALITILLLSSHLNLHAIMDPSFFTLTNLLLIVIFLLFVIFLYFWKIKPYMDRKKASYANSSEFPTAQEYDIIFQTNRYLGKLMKFPERLISTEDLTGIVIFISIIGVFLFFSSNEFISYTFSNCLLPFFAFNTFYLLVLTNNILKIKSNPVQNDSEHLKTDREPGRIGPFITAVLILVFYYGFSMHKEYPETLSQIFIALAIILFYTGILNRNSKKDPVKSSENKKPDNVNGKIAWFCFRILISSVTVLYLYIANNLGGLSGDFYYLNRGAKDVTEDIQTNAEKIEDYRKSNPDGTYPSSENFARVCTNTDIYIRMPYGGRKYNYISEPPEDGESRLKYIPSEDRKSFILCYDGNVFNYNIWYLLPPGYPRYTNEKGIETGNRMPLADALLKKYSLSTKYKTFLDMLTDF